MSNGEKVERRRGLERGGGGSENDEEEVGLSSGSLVMGRVMEPIICFSRIPTKKNNYFLMMKSERNKG